MPKTIKQTHNPAQAVRKGHKIRKQGNKEGDGARSSLKYDQFFDFLKDLHSCEARREREGKERARLGEITADVMAFFNFCKHYSQQDLDRQVIYFANLLNVLGEGVKELKFEKEAKAKLRRFLAQVLQGNSQGKAKSSKMQALLYILAVLIYKQKVDEVPHMREFQRSLYSDRCFVRLLLAIKLPKYKKIDKFYGVVMVHLSNHQQGKKAKEEIVRATIRNLPNVEHEATFFNFLVLLRSEKKKVKISIEDVLEGNTMQVLMQAYPKHLHQYQSYYILDYLTHLLSLFPCLASQIPHFFIAKLLESSAMVALHHPLHECTIVNFVQLTLRYSENPAKHLILKEVYNFLLSNRHFALKLAHIVIQYEINEGKMMELLDNGYFHSFLELINTETDQHIVSRRVEVFKKIAEKFKEINKNISDYLSYQLASRVKVIEERKRPNEAM